MQNALRVTLQPRSCTTAGRWLVARGAAKALHVVIGYKRSTDQA